MTPNNLKLNPNPPVEWRVVWEIDILAATAEDAARVARDIQRDPRSIASVFKVCGDGADRWTEIDLGEIDPVPEIPTAPAPVDDPIYSPAQAECEGWRMWIFDGRFRVVRLDDPEYSPTVFMSDAAALEFVEQQAAQGSMYHMAAVGWVGRPVPEFKSIGKRAPPPPEAPTPR